MCLIAFAIAPVTKEIAGSTLVKILYFQPFSGSAITLPKGLAIDAA
jgi:hypothetical protein